MAKPFGPNFDRALVTEPPPDVGQDTGDSQAVPVPDPPLGDHPVPSEPSEPGHSEAAAPASDEDPVDAPRADVWKNPTATLTLPFSEFSTEDGPHPGGATAHAGHIDPLMADPSAYYWEETTEAREQDATENTEDSPPRFPGRRPLYKRSEPEPSAEEQLADVIGFLRKLQTTIRQVEATAETPSPAELGLTLLQLRRLSRTGVAPDHFQIGVLPKVMSLPAPEAVPLPVAVEPAQSGEVPPLAVPVRLERRHAVWLVLTGLVCLATLCLVGYLWTRVGLPSRVHVAPRNFAGPGAPSPAQETEVSEEALHLANLTLEAIQHGELKKASDILAKARQQHVVLPGLDYQAALLAFNQGQAQDADDFLTRSIEANEAVSDCWYLRANAAFYTEGPASAAKAFEEASHASPFSPRFYFFRAECLRRNGNAAAAVGQFQQALRCRPTSGDTDLILFKIGLTKLESNTDIIFKTELHDHLSQEPVSGDTLLLAAADAISRNEFAEAADFLKRAALVLPARIFQSRIRDYVFQAQAKQPDIAAVLKLTLPTGTPGQPPPTHAGRTLIDPATRSLAEADPAGW